ncbi:MAG: maleylpyruvate isomerase family mycothiol-dependent enzyme [Actinomycetales bacterium]
MSDAGDLTAVLSAMDHTWGSIIALAVSLRPEELALPTRCPGWDVHDQLAHIASLERQLAGGELPPEAPPAPYIRNPVGARMERGVHAMRGWPAERLVDELRLAIEARRIALQANPPRSGDTLTGVMGNPVPAERSLPIRVFDLWIHEQDVRVATGRPGNEAGPGAHVGRDCILGMIPLYWAKNAGAAPGQTFQLRVTGALPFERTVVVDAEGRASYAGSGPAPVPVAALELDWLDLAARANGRTGADQTPVHIEGDRAMATAMVEALPMSP